MSPALEAGPFVRGIKRLHQRFLLIYWRPYWSWKRLTIVDKIGVGNPRGFRRIEFLAPYIYASFHRKGVENNSNADYFRRLPQQPTAADTSHVCRLDNPEGLATYFGRANGMQPGRVTSTTPWWSSWELLPLPPHSGPCRPPPQAIVLFGGILKVDCIRCDPQGVFKKSK